MKVEWSCFLISGVQYIRARFEQEKQVMELEKINAILKRETKEPRQFDNVMG